VAWELGWPESVRGGVHSTQEGLDDLPVTVGLLGHGQVSGLLEDGRLGAPDSVDEGLDERGCHLVIATRGNQHRQVEFAQAGGDIPVP
jgi:hypothetical protein